MVRKAILIITGLAALAAPLWLATAATTPELQRQPAMDAPLDARTDATDRLFERVRTELTSRYPGAKIELTGGVRWIRGALPPSFGRVEILNDTRGEAHFNVDGAEGIISFAAWVPARIAVRRILPGERLSDELFVTQELNTATGQPHQYRGVILPASQNVKGLETRQTVLEGQFLTSSAVQRIPDVRRGDMVRIQLHSGLLTLTTIGTAEEPAYIDGRVRVLTTKQKRELVGQLRSGGIVEVAL